MMNLSQIGDWPIFAAKLVTSLDLSINAVYMLIEENVPVPDL
jgi:hypothetical protein